MSINRGAAALEMRALFLERGGSHQEVAAGWKSKQKGAFCPHPGGWNSNPHRSVSPQSSPGATHPEQSRAECGREVSPPPIVNRKTAYSPGYFA